MKGRYGIEFNEEKDVTEYDMLMRWLYWEMARWYKRQTAAPDPVYFAVDELLKTLDREEKRIYGRKYLEKRERKIFNSTRKVAF